MPYDPENHRRRSIRLRGYDYSSPGYYFVTVCTQNRECLFGEVVDGEMRLNEAGRMVQKVWNEMARHYPLVDVDVFVIMPNHIHGIIVLAVGAGPRACPDNALSCGGGGRPRGAAPTVGDAMHRFKSLTTALYRHGVKQHGWLPFRGRLWQRNYYERVIRDEDELKHIRQYIAGNPWGWDKDPENPLAATGLQRLPTLAIRPL